MNGLGVTTASAKVSCPTVVAAVCPVEIVAEARVRSTPQSVRRTPLQRTGPSRFTAATGTGRRGKSSEISPVSASAVIPLRRVHRPRRLAPPRAAGVHRPDGVSAEFPAFRRRRTRELICPAWHARGVCSVGYGTARAWVCVWTARFNSALDRVLEPHAHRAGTSSSSNLVDSSISTYSEPSRSP